MALDLDQCLSILDLVKFVALQRHPNNSDDLTSADSVSVGSRDKY